MRGDTTSQFTSRRILGSIKPIYKIAFLAVVAIIIVATTYTTNAQEKTRQHIAACEYLIRDGVAQAFDKTNKTKVREVAYNIDKLEYLKEEDGYHVFWLEYSGSVGSYSNSEKETLYCQVTDNGNVFYSTEKK